MYAGAQTTTSFVNTLLPAPAKITVEQGRLQWSASFSVSAPGFHDARLDATIFRTLRELEGKTGTPLSKEIGTAAAGATLVVAVRGAGEAIQSPDEDESYSLSVTNSGAKLEAATVVGATRGLQTFLQLLQTEPTGYYFPTVQIEDAPRFQWR